MVTQVYYSLRSVLDDANAILQKNSWIIPDQFCVLVFLSLCSSVLPIRRRPAPCFHHHSRPTPSSLPSRPYPACIPALCCRLALPLTHRRRLLLPPRVILFHIELKMGFSLPPAAGYALAEDGWIYKTEEAIGLGGSC
jgi:hypothetical protein